MLSKRYDVEDLNWIWRFLSETVTSVFVTAKVLYKEMVLLLN